MYGTVILSDMKHNIFHEKDTDEFILSIEESVKYGLIDRIMRADEGVVKANKGI